MTTNELAIVKKHEREYKTKMIWAMRVYGLLCFVAGAIVGGMYL